MRSVQIALFSLTLVMFVAALFFIGKDTGDTLWRARIAALLLDVVYIMLWPTPSQRQNTLRES